MSRANSQNPNLDVQVEAFIRSLTAKGGRPLHEIGYDAARKVLRDVQDICVEKGIVDIKDIDIPLENGGAARIRLICPEDAGIRLPVIFYIHGGGWVMGDENTHDRLIRELAVGANAAVVFPVYEPAPEAQYPEQLNMMFTVLEHIARHSREYNFSSRVALAGDSVGGNMATVLAMMSKKKGFPEIACQLLYYPVTDAAMDTDSYLDFAEGPWLTAKAMAWFWDAYLPDMARRNEVYASPLNATAEELRGLPSALVITAENDVLRDEGEAYARKLSAAGVKTASLRVNGTIHDFLMLNGIAASEPTRAAVLLSVCYLRQMLKEKY